MSGTTGDLQGTVFLSHNSADKIFVRRLAGDLRSQNVRVWLDEWEMKVGDSLSERVQQGIEGSSFLAIVLTPRSVLSSWVRRELNAALVAELERNSVFILPVLAEDCEIPLFLRDKLYADFRSDYMSGLRALMKAVVPTSGALPSNLLFDFTAHDPQFRSWGFHFSRGAYIPAVRLISDANEEYLVMEASESQTIGINKSIATLHGRVEFEYRAEGENTVSDPHIYFAVIPMQETGYGRTGVIEVGGDVQADPRNARSPHRLRFYVPSSVRDGQWHVGSVDFDFRSTPTAFYTIFAPRINEGSTVPARGRLAVRRVKIYGW